MLAPVSQEATITGTEEAANNVKKFRDQMNALGGVNILASLL